MTLLYRRNIIKFLTAVFLMATLSSCIYDSFDSDSHGGYTEDPFIILRINALDATMTSNDLGDTHEMVKSLRVIMLNNGAIELNRYVLPGQSEEGINMAELNYILTARTIEGTKKFYLFANEESVTDLQFKSDVEFEGTLPTNLHSYLESITPDTDDAAAGQNFENIVNAIYFQPKYEANTLGNIYLPYTSYYEGYEVSSDSPSNTDSPLQMFLVPVATKFVFQFVNYRLNPVEVNNITVSSTNLDNFLLARVNYPDDTKSFEGKDYYWVNWLAKVSEASHSNSDVYDNMNFNEKYGWISHYDMPDISTVQESVFIDETNFETVPAGKPIEDSEDINPSSVILGPFYAPESWNQYTYVDNYTDEEVTIQRYGLTLGLHDVTSLPGRDPVFEDVAIENLQALFRNTCVVIKITMSSGPVDVYAEINPWNIKTANGWLVEGNAPSNNPFAK